jgi:hypothetical protein
MAFTNFTSATLNLLTNFDAAAYAEAQGKFTAYDTAFTAIGAPSVGVEVVTSGALALAPRESQLSITNTVAFTLADGTSNGQQKIIECTVVSGTPVGTLTITTPISGEGATHVFTAVKQRMTLEWTTINGSTGWHMISKTRAGRQAVTVGTTVLRGATANSGSDMALAYDLSVTGTVHSTGTKGIPDGTIPGERIHLDVLTAASTATGDIDITAWTTVGVAATNWGSTGTSIGSAGTNTTAVLEAVWDGTKWQAIIVTTATLG